MQKQELEELNDYLCKKLPVPTGYMLLIFPEKEDPQIISDWPSTELVKSALKKLLENIDKPGAVQEIGLN